MANGKRRSRSEGESERASSEHATSPAPSSRSTTKQQVRHRASIACASCRERRIRCVVGEGESECTQCRRTGAACIIKDDDERRRPISKAYMSSLSNRINLLEGLLKDRGVVPPPAVHPPKTRQEAQARQQEQHQVRTGSERLESAEPKLAAPHVNQPPTPPASGDEDVNMIESEQLKTFPSGGPTNFSRLIDPLLLQEVEPKTEAGTRHLLCTRGSYTFDQGARRTRFFGPTANHHVYAKSANTFAPLEQSSHDFRAEQLILNLRPATYDHLMRCFWEYYNSWQQVVDEPAFEAGRASQDARFYSVFLHLTMLAIGYRFADWDREDVKTITLGNRESTLHREAKTMLEAELERPGGVPSVQALLMLADLECGVGRDTTGWMYSGMANRLAFDIGLHVNMAMADMSELERQTRRQAMTACAMFDRKWSLLMGRPTAIKTQDVGVDVLPRVSAPPFEDSNLGTVASHATINRQMFELLELAGKVADFQNSTYGAAHLFSSKAAEDRAYLHFIGLERLFHNWYRRLPENLTWKPVNIKSAHMGLFILHQQFHVCMIILHRPWAKYGPMSLDGTVAARYPSPGSPSQGDETSLPSWMAPLPHHDNRASMSRSMCTQHAIRIARIFWHHRQRFDGKRVVLTSIQHAGTAALALLAALAHKSAELDHHSNLRYLQVLSTAIYEMSHLYQPATRMYQLLKSMLVDIRSEMVKSGGFDVSTLVGRYQGSNTAFGGNQWTAGASTRMPTGRLEGIEEDGRESKRRRLSSLSSIDFSCISPSFLTNTDQGRPTPPASSQSQSINPTALDQTPSEPGTFDLDFFHASFVDFINTGGDGPNAQDWLPADVETSVPVLIPTVSGDLSVVGNDTDNAPAPANKEPRITTPKPPTDTPDQVSAATPDDDDTAVDKTIEDWLAEPTKPAAPATTKDSHPQPPSTTTTTPQPTQLPKPDPVPSATEPRDSLSYATADGTPICRDPYVLSLETELGVGFGLGPDTVPTTSSNPTTTTEGADTIHVRIADGMDWLAAAAAATTSNNTTNNSNGTGRSPPNPKLKPTPAASSPSPRPTTTTTTTTTSSSGASATGGAGATEVPPAPMTPVTLDELVQSVEEAVGSARARARARAAAGGSAVGQGSGMGVGVGAGAGVGAGEGALSSPAGGRNRELDFLML
ncbi:fungal-specific transcription factor domain-containing protein [Chaetomium tenue]|uniref:Fungal-specific transcription factor domain-containing protein n=1 Tax=Chaetomium tenue TaxID=1854479 RepID=A0ACB7P0I2_9PEZI|nr:fungal-specific transcription factor domain-containing protein [Chaetomium globosum]